MTTINPQPGRSTQPTHLDNSSFMGANDILGRVPLLARETAWPLLAYSSVVLINLKLRC